MPNKNLTSFSIQSDGTLIEDEQSQPATTAEVSQERAQPEAKAEAKAKAKKPGQPKQARDKSGHDTDAAEDTEAAQNIIDADAQAILDDIDEDYSEALLEELDALQEELTSKASQPSMSLANKIAQMGEDFPVSNGVRYGDTMWSLPHGPHAHPNNIRFDRELLL